MKKIGVVRFLGTNCDQDVFDALKAVENIEPQWLWYEDQFDVDQFDGLVVPGGFSYGDYLRCGALASKMPVMDSVDAFAKRGGKVLGICNGFQILCERGLLPGVLMRNEKINFIDKWINLSPVAPKTSDSIWPVGADCKMPIAHGEGRFFIDEAGLKELKANDQVWLCYSNNPNGSVEDIAGVLNKEKNVAGLMPHPERAVSEWMGGKDGLKILESFV